MTPDQRATLIDLLSSGEEIAPEWARIIFPPDRREYELVYGGKARDEEVLAETLAVPLQPVRTFGSGRSQNDSNNMLIFGDNLQVMKSLLQQKRDGLLRNADGSEGVRVVYIDPPFASKQDFKGAQEEKAYQDRIAGSHFLEFLRKRLILIRELLADDGTLYLHMDWRKVHYAKVLCDEIFSENRFRNEVIWNYKRWSAGSSQFQRQHDTLLVYSKSAKPLFNVLYDPYTEGTLRRWKGIKRKTTIGEDGKLIQVQAESGEEGANMGDVWSISIINANANERTGYPTQKPEELIERVIRASSNEGDLVLDAFAGSGTTCAVAEKLKRRWIGIDCGKLAIYKMQQRLLTLRTGIGHQGEPLPVSHFTLYNAGLYDFSKLRELPWHAWRFFALQLFQCREEPHSIGGIKFDGYLKGASVLVFDHMKHAGARVDEQTIESIHHAVSGRVGSRVFIIAPSLTFDFQQDYLEIGDVRYYALRIPYSIVQELHKKEFLALLQPADPTEVNATVEAVGFDFIRTPELSYELGTETISGRTAGFISLKSFQSEASVQSPPKEGPLATLSMVLLDTNFDVESDVIDVERVVFGEAIRSAGNKILFPLPAPGTNLMAVFVDIYGNEARELIPASGFGDAPASPRKLTPRSKTEKVN